MTEAMSRRPVNVGFMKGTVSTTQKDLTDDRYRDLRRPRKLRFYVNGDRFFKGKKLYVTPHRYHNFNDLLTDLTGKLPPMNLPFGVRQIFTPLGGHRISDIEQLADGEQYVCAGFEGFKSNIKYGIAALEPWSTARPHNHDSEQDAGYPGAGYRGGRPMFGANGFHPSRLLHGTNFSQRKFPGTFGTASRSTYLPHSDNTSIKPKVVTIVRNGTGNKPRVNVKILLNRRSVQSFEQLMSDISEAFGPKYKNNRVKKLFTIRTREVQGVADFFRDDDVFIAVGNETLTENDIQDIIEETCSDKPGYAKSVLKDLERQKRKRQAAAAAALKDSEADKRDSGFGEGSDGSNRDNEDVVIYKGHGHERSKRRNDYPKEYELSVRVDKERDKAAYDERDRMRKRQQKMIEAERRALDDERRRRGLIPPMGAGNDPFKRMKEQKEREKEEARKRREEERRKREEEDNLKQREKDREDRERAVQAARERQAAAEKAEREKADQEKTDKKKIEADSDEKSDKEKKNEANKENRNDQKNDKDQKSRKKSKIKVIRKSKLERQVSSDEHVLNKYDLGRTLGDGNFAIVRQAKLKSAPSEYALKVIDKPKLKGKEHMVENEIEIMKDCNHQNIVKLYEEYETSDKIYLVMELVKGGDLFDAITQSVKFGEVDSAHMVRDLCNALFYLHSRSIVHRDLKPENLLVHRNKDSTISLKLADFGLAMEVKELIYTVCGTPTYVAPEILSEIGYGLEVDMWAVGVICYILLCGFPPFRSPDRNQTELFEFIKAGEYEFLSPYWDHISPSAKDLIEHLLVVDKKKRYTAIDTLSHPWILRNGDMTNPPDKAKLEEMSKATRKELELQAKMNLESYQKVKEKRASQ